MKRRNFLGFLAGALVAAREAFIGDVETEEPETTSPTCPRLAPPVPDPNVSTFPPVPRVFVTADGRLFEGKLLSWTGVTNAFNDKMDVTTRYEYTEVKSKAPPPRPTCGAYDLSYNGEIVGRGTWQQNTASISGSKPRDA